MTPERWQQVKGICYAVLDRVPEERGALLDALCLGDDELKRDVAVMIADATRLGARSEGSRSGWMPDTIGSYRILRLVGEGGMGVVYEAQQDQPQRTVALKVIKPGLASPEVLRRFRLESQALGRLQHPGIAQIYEAGTADSGFGPQPYFAMEFIRGESLSSYADTHRLNVPQRLELMARICDAVDHAHQRGLIHRDLKPANILIDESGQPKILDFGVARLTDSDVQRTQHTDLGQLVGTLAYMSPEQVLADPLELDTRSDVYALGVILYELLAGRLPYTVSARVHEAVKTIQQEDPKRLSSVSRVYRGDLETIAAKALEKDKTRRYGSASALAADIRRYLHNEPIAARPASASYQLQKFARRHRALVTGVAAVFVVLTVGIVATTREAIRARRAEQTAVAAEQTAQAVNDFLQNDLLAQASANTQAGPGVKPDPDLKVRTALDRAAARIEGKFAGQPTVEASIRRTIGRTYRDLGLYPEAQGQLERSLELRRRLLGESHPDLVDAMDDVAHLYYLQGKYELAEPLIGKVVEIRQRVAGDEDPDTLSAMSSLGLLYGFQGKDGLAAPLLARTLDARRRVSGATHPETLTVMVNLAQVYDRQGKYREAEALFTQALEISRRVRGEEHPETLSAMNNLSSVYRNQGKYAEAESLLDSTLAIRRRVLGEEHPNTLTAMNNLGNIYVDKGKIADAETIFTRLLEIRRRVLGDKHPNTLLTMNNLARVLRFQGKYPQAEALLTNALEIQRRVLGDEHLDTLLVMSNLGFIYWLEGNYRQANVLLDKALEIRKRVSGADHPDTIFELERLALVHQSERRYSQAEELFTRVFDVRRRVLGDEHANTLRASSSLGQVQLIQQKFGDAARTLKTSLDMYQKSGLQSWQRYSCQALLGASLAGQKKYSEAEPLLVAGYEGMVRVRATIPAYELHYIEDAGRTLVQLYKDSGNRARATEWSRKLQQMRK